MEKVNFIESFADLDDACDFLDNKILEYVSQGYDVSPGTGLVYTNNRWRAGVSFEKGEVDE